MKVRIIKSLSVKIWYGQNFNSEKQKSYVLIFYFILFFSEWEALLQGSLEGELGVRRVSV